jgi:hypothetical protein
MPLNNQQNNRSQDYLVTNQAQGQNQNTQQPLRLSTPSYTANAFDIRGGTGGNSTAPMQDLTRQRMKAQKRQVTENRPVDFNVNLQSTKARTQGDLSGQFNDQSTALAKRMPQVNEFLPDFTKAIENDSEEAQQRTAQRLTGNLSEYVTPNIDTGADDEMQAFLGKGGVDAFLTQLQRERGGGLSGVNRLDAAILGYSGAGQNAFDRARGELSQVANQRFGLQDQLRQRAAEQDTQYKSAQEQLLGAVKQRQADFDTTIAQRQQDYRNRDVSAELASAIEKARIQAATGGFADYFPGGLGGNEQFVNRELTREQALEAPETRQYNDLMDLLGGNAIQTQARGPSIREDALIASLLAEAARRKSAPENYTPTVAKSDGRIGETTSSPTLVKGREAKEAQSVQKSPEARKIVVAAKGNTVPKSSKKSNFKIRAAKGG